MTFYKRTLFFYEIMEPKFIIWSACSFIIKSTIEMFTSSTRCGTKSSKTYTFLDVVNISPYTEGNHTYSLWMPTSSTRLTFILLC